MANTQRETVQIWQIRGVKLSKYGKREVNLANMAKTLNKFG